MLQMLGLVVKFIKPLFWIFQKTHAWLEKRLVQPLYMVSHRKYLRQKAPETRWETFSNYFEYRLEFEDVFSNDDHPVAELSLRSIAGQRITYIKIGVTVSGGTKRYQEVFEAIDICETETIIKLNSIPILEMRVYEDGFLPTFSDVRVKLLKIVFDEENEDIFFPGPVETRFTLTHQQFLRSEWARKWDFTWNLDYYNLDAMQSLQEAIIQSLLDIDQRMSFFTPWSSPSSLWWRFKIGLTRMLLHEVVLGKLLWFLLLTRISYMNEDDEFVSSIPIFKVEIWKKVLFSQKEYAVFRS